VLHQFRASHFNEKARWGLDWKGIRHRRVTHLPGPHMFAIRRLTGHTQVPVLELEGHVVAGSARILLHLDERYPEPALQPADPAARERALMLQSWLDAEVGPAVRTVVFSVLLDEPGFLARMFAGHLSPLLRGGYRATLPFARGLMARANGTDPPENIRKAFETSERALDRVASEIGPKGHLVGDSFCVADLTAAALLAPLVGPDHPDMAFPEPVPESVEALRARFASHEAVVWVREQYARHRPAACDGAEE
jgi:glutathione S-transferase